MEVEFKNSAVQVADSRDLETPHLAGTTVVAEAVAVDFLPERMVQTAESLLSTLDTALTTYSFMIDTVNNSRLSVKGRRKDRPVQFEIIDHDVIRAEVESLVNNPDILSELQCDIDYFTNYPEKNSPDAGYDIVIIPEGLTATDEVAIAREVQAKITSDYTPYIRSSLYNDKRFPQNSGKGFRIAFAPRHYNIPEYTTAKQTGYMRVLNNHFTAIKLVTATDVEVLAQINNLQVTGELNDPNTRFDKTNFRRFDQVPVDEYVSRVRVIDFGRLDLNESEVDYEIPSRALYVPLAQYI